MKRTHVCNHLNGNNLYDNADPPNSPDLVFTSLWLPEEHSTRNAIEIIELNTSDEIEDKDQPHNNRTWSYKEDKLRHLEDKYKINKTAREKRRLRNQNLFTTNTAIDRNRDEFFRSDISGDYINDSKYKGSHNANCITLINKNIIDFDSSFESNSDIEIIATDNLNASQWNPDGHYDAEYANYESELNKEKHTIWIYSFKNKSLLSEDYANGYDDSSSSPSSGNCEENAEGNDTNTNRLATPIPPLYIPRLNLPLVPTLSTVTEISDVPKPPSSNGSVKSTQTFQKRRNNWLRDIDNFENVKTDKSSNIVNWMALSPREKRRRINYLEDRWNGTILHLDTPQKQDQQRAEVRAEVYVNEDSERSGKSTKTTPLRIVNSDRITTDKIEHQINARVNSKSVHNSPANISIISTPHVQVTTRRSGGADKPQPIQNLESDNWTNITKIEKETAAYDYISKTLEIYESEPKSSRDHIDKLWMKNNAPLMKPPEWDKFISIGESNVSLHLSLGSIIQERKPWYRRLIRFFTCCK